MGMQLVGGLSQVMWQLMNNKYQGLRGELGERESVEVIRRRRLIMG